MRRIAAMACVAGLAAGVSDAAWVSAVQADPAVSAEELAPRAVEGPIRFSFKDAPYDMVIDWFSRQTGLPVIREAEPPGSAMTFISAQDYSFEEALGILNLNLRMHGLHLRREANFLYLATLADAVREGGPVAAGAVPDDVAPGQMLTLTIPLNNALARSVSEQVAPLVGPYGRVTPVEAQNMVIVFETVEQCRRIQEVIQAIDAEKPADSEYRLFPLRHAQADAVVGALKGLVGERQRTVIVDEKGKQRVVEDTAVPGLNIQADPRTNSVIAVGPSGRLETIAELVALLDTPEGDGGERSLRTFALRRATPEEAAQTLEALFRAVPESRRPTVVRLDAQNKVTVLASPSLLVQAEALVSQLEGGTPADGAPATESARVVRLAHATPEEARSLLTQLLPAGSVRALRLAPAPGGAALVVSGASSEVDFAVDLLASIDTAAAGSTEVRVLELSGDLTREALANARELLASARPEDAAAVSVEVREDASAAVLTGPGAALDALLAMVDRSEVLVAGGLASRTIELSETTPSRMAETLARVLPALLDGGALPEMAPIDELDRLVVRGRAADLEVVERLVAQLDTPGAARTTVRVVPLAGAEPESLLRRARELYELAAAERAGVGSVETRLDAATGRLLVVGSREAVALMDESLRQAQQLMPPERQTRLFELGSVEPSAIAARLVELVEAAETREGASRPATMTATALDQADTLVVDADPSQMGLVERFVQRLDQIEPAELPPLRLVQVRTADAASIATMLTEQYRKRPQAERAGEPVEVRADAGTNTLIVSAGDEVFEQIRSFVRELDSERVDGPERVTVLFPLKVAKAVDVAAAMGKLYPPPPTPVDSRGRPMTWLRQPSEVTVSAEPSSNALIIDAPAERIESLQELASKLDRVELPPVAELRTYRIVGADINAIATTLRALAQRGNLSAPAQPGTPPVEVVIEAEPMSGTLIVAGDETTFGRVESMLEDLAAVPVERQLRIVPVANAQAESVRTRALEIYRAQVAGLPDAGDVEVSVDAETNTLMVVADEEAMERFIAVLEQLQRQVGPARETRLIELRFAEAPQVVAFLTELRDDSRAMRIEGGAEPVFEVVERTNSVLVAAQPAQFPVIEELIRSVDSRETAERPPLRILKLRTTDAENLASVLRRTYESRPMDDRLKRPVDVEADAATNTLVVSAHEDLLAEIEGIVEQLNATDTLVGDDREIRIFPLAVARAEELARTLDAMFPEPAMPIDPRTRLPRPDLQRPKEVVVRADRGTNAIIVDAPARRLAGFEELVKSLDRQEISGDADVRTYRVRRASIEQAAAAIRELASGGALGAATRTPITVSSEASTSTLIVSGPVEAFGPIETVIRELEGADDAPATVLRLYPLKFARAERMAETIRPVAELRVRELPEMAAAGPDEVARVLQIVGERTSNTLVVSAPEAVQEAIDAMVRALDSERSSAGPKAGFAVYVLAHAGADAVARTIEPMLRDRATWPDALVDAVEAGEAVAEVVVTADAQADRVVVSGPEALVERAGTLIEVLDRPRGDLSGRETAVIALAQGSAEGVGAAVRAAFEGERAPTVSIEPTSNSILIVGTPEQVARARALAREMDSSSEPDGVSVRTIYLEHAQAEAVAPVLEQVLRQESALDMLPDWARAQYLWRQEGQVQPRVRVIAERRLNAVVVSGPASMLALAEEIVRELDVERRAAGSGRVVRVLSLRHADAGEAQRTLGQVFAETDDGLEPPVIGVDRSSNALIVRGTAEQADEVERIVASLDDAAVAGGRQLRTLYVDRSRTSATELARVLRDVLGQREGLRVEVISADELLRGPGRDAPPDEGETPDGGEAPDEQPAGATSSMVPGAGGPAGAIVYASVSAVLSASEPTPPADITIAVDEETGMLLILGGDRASERVAALARELMEELPAEPGRVRVIELPSAVDARLVAQAVTGTVRQVGRGSEQNPGGFTGQVSIVADPAGSALIVWANDTDFPSVRQIVAALAGGGAGEDLVARVYTLRNVRAESALRALNDLLSSSPQGIQAQRLRSIQVDGASAAFDPAQVRLAADPTGSILIAVAPEPAAEVLDRFVAMLDQTPAEQQLAIRRYAVEAGRAAEVAQTLQQVFDAQRQGPNVRDLPRARFLAEPGGSALLVTASPAQHDEVARVLGEVLAGEGEDVRVVTVPLASARASEVAQALRQALPESVRVRVTPVSRSNTLLLTGSPSAIEAALERIREIDQEPTRTLQEFRRFALTHAMADDVFMTLSRVVRAQPREPGEPAPAIDYSMEDNALLVSAPADRMEELAQIIAQLDVEGEAERTTEFVALEHADAEQAAAALRMFFGRFAPEAATPSDRNVTILPDASANALVISADEQSWAGIRELLGKIDTADYDASRRIEVIPMLHADATSVARALSEGFQAPLARELARRQTQRGGQREDDRRESVEEIAALLSSEDRPIVSAEPQTNSLIVFAVPRELERIQSLVRQLDVPEFVKMAPARVIPLRAGRASRIAESIRTIFESESRGGSRALAVVGDDTAGALIVRADDAQYERVLAVAESLQAQSERALAAPRLIVLRTASASRVRDLLQAALEPLAVAMGETLVVEADRGRNALLVTASERLGERVDALVAQLDAAPEGPDGAGSGDEGGGGSMLPGGGDGVTLVALEHHAPDQMIALLTGLGATEPATDGPGLVDEVVRLTAVPASNGIAIAGSSGDRRTVERLARSLDEAAIEQAERVEMVRLRVASADRVAQTLLELLGQARTAPASGPGRTLAEHVRRLAIARGDGEAGVDLARPIRLVADPASNTLMVASSAANAGVVAELARSLDTLPLGETVMVRFFPLENASAGRLKGLIDQLFAAGEAVRRTPGTARSGDSVTATGRALAGTVFVGVDERTNALLAAGPEESVALVEVLVRDLDRESDSQWIEPAVLPLEHADARQLADLLREVLVVGVQATPEAEALRRQVGRLRVAERTPEGAEPSFAVADVFTPMSSLVIRADADANALVVVGSRGNLAVVGALAEMLDVPMAGVGNAVRIYPLEHASAERIAGLAGELFRQRQAAADLRPEDQLIITSDARTNALIVTTSQRSFALFEGLLEALDVERTDDAIGLRVLPVAGVDVRELAPRVQRLMRERLAAIARVGSVRTEQEVFTVEADPAAGALLIASSEENFRIAEELVEALAREGDALANAETTALVPVGPGRVADVAQTVNELYVRREQERRGVASVRVVPSERLNALLVAGTAADVERVRAIVEDLARASLASVQDVRRFELRSANAVELVGLLESVLAGRPISGSRAGEAQALRLRFFREQVQGVVAEEDAGDPRTEAEIDGLIRDQVRLTPDLRKNSVIASAPPAIMEMIGAIVEDLDTTSAGSRKIEMYRLNNADARAMAELLRDLFNLSQQGDRLVLLPTTPAAGAPDGEPVGFGDTTLTPVPDVRQELSITIDARTNTLLVSGTPEYLELVGSVVEELDGIEANERESFVYSLRNAKADEVEQTLQGYFENEAARIRALLGPEQAGSALRQLEQEVTVVGDVASNKLIVSASPRYVQTVQSIIEELDATPPQVMIQVLLAEVTLDDSQTWGIDINVGPLGNQEWQGSSTIHGAAGLATAIGVPNLAVSTADFSLLVRALEAQGRLEVLSRPQVTVNNNQEASIQVGDDVAIVEAVERLDNGNTRSDVTRRDVGIILNVTPSISADGFVRMDIVPEISTVSQRTTQISEEFEAPIINVRKVDTTVTVRDGETVVIGGLIQTIEEERLNKVPLIGDIPILGLPFRTSRTERIRTELLVILTPTVVPGDGPDGMRRLEMATQRAIDGYSNPGAVRSELADPPTPDLTRELRDGEPPADARRWPVPIDDSPFPRPRGGGR